MSPPSLMTPVKLISSGLTCRQSKWDTLEELWATSFPRFWLGAVFVCTKMCVCWRGEEFTVRDYVHICSVSLSKHSLFLSCLFPFFLPCVLLSFSSVIYCQKGPRLKSHFSTAWHQHRRTSTPVPIVSQFAIGGLWSGTGLCACRSYKNSAGGFQNRERIGLLAPAPSGWSSMQVFNVLLNSIR